MTYLQTAYDLGPIESIAYLLRVNRLARDELDVRQIYTASVYYHNRLGRNRLASAAIVFPCDLENASAFKLLEV